MSLWKLKLTTVQESIKNSGYDGWLLYDFRKSNDLACHFMEIPEETLLTRRFYYWIPQIGEPIKIVHRIESHVLAHLPGKELVYSSYEELEKQLAIVIKHTSRIAMEYSPRNAIPTVSKVDAGTIDLIRSLGATVESSADLLQPYTSIWTPEQFVSHKAAAEVLQNTVELAWKIIAKAVKNNDKINEADVQRFIIGEFEKHGCIASDPPICAVNANSANPHYSPTSQGSQEIKSGDFVLIDVWCKKNTPHAVYADITRVGIVGAQPTKRQQEIFDIVKAGRDAAIALVSKRLKSGEPIMGWEVDQACRDVINDAGYGQYFTHRTGHNIGERDHGDGANIDNFETRDFRKLLPGTCFSIEPGIYLPGEFGVRLEDDVYLDANGRELHLTVGMQEEIFSIS
ncbi:MAG TPA: M24 family metallopeptidase [Parachlamydiaceae bacterium]|nr:M24 family metallopeptidase [Parachlamydiaceae bacterium]